MRFQTIRKWRLLLFLHAFLIPTCLFGEATLVSVKKGGEGDRAWTVLSFDQKCIWAGITEKKAGLVSIYFYGSAGRHEGETIPLVNPPGGSIYIHKVSDAPSIFRIDLACSVWCPLAVLKQNRNVVIAFNDLRMLEGSLTKWDEDISPTPGRMTGVVPSVENDQVMTTLSFEGSTNWAGYLRPSRETVALLIRGVENNTSEQDITIEESPLNQIHFFTEGNDGKTLRALLRFSSPSPVSVVKKSRTLVVQTPRITERMAVRQEEAGVAVDVGSLLPDETALSDANVDALAELLDIESESSSGQADAFEKLQPEPVPVDTPDAMISQPVASTTTESNRLVGDASVQTQELDSVTLQDVESDLIPWNNIVGFRFNNTPIRNALRTIAISNGLNMVVTDGVEGMVTMNLRDVTLRQALEKIVYTSNCEYIIDDGIITIKPVKVTYSGGRLTKVYRIKYADAENVASVIKQVASSDSLVKVFRPDFLNFDDAGKNRKESNEVAIQGIRRSSTLVVTDSPEKIREIDAIILQLDRAPVQIMIESRLVEMAPIERNELGINWDKTITAALQWQDILPNGDEKNYSVINTDPGGGGEWNMGHLSASQFEAVLDFLQEKTESKLISNPKLLAMDNEESSISVGTTVPVPRIQRGMGGQGDMVTFEYKEVNIQLNVTPHVAASGEITMYVNPVIEEITGWVVYEDKHRAPITDKRTVNSIVSVRNGETIVIGGLIKNQRSKTKQKVWLLGSLPLIGRLFQHEIYEDKQTDLMIFITPTIVQG